MEYYDDDDNAGSKIFSRKDLVNSRARLRSQINRDQESANKRASYMARAIIEAGRRDEKKDPDEDRSQALAYGISNLASKVLASLKINIPMFLKQTYGSGHRANARTDFKSITLTVNTRSFDMQNKDSIIDLMYMVKGLVYHEGGHNMWTLPFPKLQEQAKPAMGTVARDVWPNETVGRPGIATTFGELIIKYAPDLINVIDKDVRTNIWKLHEAWNILEDQRMETAMCVTSPVMAKYFTNIVINIVINDNPQTVWPYMAGRTYLPKAIRQHIRDLAEEHPHASIIPEMNDIIMRYRESNDVFEMYECVLLFAECLEVWHLGTGRNNTVDGHSFDGDFYQPGVSELPIVPKPDSNELEEPKGGKEVVVASKESSGKDVPESEVPNESLTDSKVKPDEPKAEDKQTDTPGAAAGAPKSTPSTDFREEIKKAKQDIRDAVTENEVLSFVSEVNEATNSSIKPDLSVMEMNSDQVNATNEVTNGMRNVLENIIVQNEPNWVHYQEEGVLDPSAFVMRRPGDTDYWSGLNGVGATGHDLAVSILLDTSGSMMNDTSNVSIAAIGIRKACDALGIPCTVTSFNDDVFMVAKADEEIGYPCVRATGGTSVLNAFRALGDQRYDKRHHLAVVLTDGEWFDVEDMRPWGDPGRYFLLVGFNMDKTSLMNKGANQVVVVREVNELPALVTGALIDYFA